MTSTTIPRTSPELLRDLVARLRRSTLDRLTRATPEALYWQPDAEANGAYHAASLDSTLTALANDTVGSLSRPLPIGDDEDSRFEQTLGPARGVDRHLGKTDAPQSPHSRLPAAHALRG